MISATRSGQQLAIVGVQAGLVMLLLSGCSSAQKLAGTARADSDGTASVARNQPAAASSIEAGGRFVEAPGHASDLHNPDQSMTSQSAEFAAPATDRNHQFQLASARTTTASTPATNAVPALSTLGAHENLDARLAAAPGMVLIDFYADWCGPCRRQGKILHDLEAEAARYNAIMIKVDIEQHPELAQRYDASRLPTLIALRGGQIVQRQTGLASAEQVTAMLQN